MNDGMSCVCVCHSFDLCTITDVCGSGVTSVYRGGRSVCTIRLCVYDDAGRGCAILRTVYVGCVVGSDARDDSFG